VYRAQAHAATDGLENDAAEAGEVLVFTQEAIHDSKKTGAD